MRLRQSRLEQAGAIVEGTRKISCLQSIAAYALQHADAYTNEARTTCMLLHPAAAHGVQAGDPTFKVAWYI